MLCLAVAVQGGVTGAPVAAQVAPSLMPPTTTDTEVRGRKSANPDGAGKVVMSITLNRNRVIEPPVLFTHLRRMLSVPKVELLAGSLVKSRTRWGEFELATVASSRFTVTVELRLIGDDRLSGPGAHNLWPAPAEVPLVSTKMKSARCHRIFRRAYCAKTGVWDRSTLPHSSRWTHSQSKRVMPDNRCLLCRWCWLPSLSLRRTDLPT